MTDKKTLRVFFLSLFVMMSSLYSPAVYAQWNPSIPEKVQVGLDKSIFLDLRDINVVDILKFLALQGNLNIVTSKNVQGRSTLVLRDVRIQDALDIIVISNQLAYEIKDEIIYIMPEEEYVQIYGKTYNDKRRIATRTLKYAKPSYVSTTLQAVQSSIGKVIVEEDTGTVIMIDTAEKLLQMNKLLDDMENQVETAVVSLQNAKVADIEAQLKLRLDAKSVGTVTSDERSNQLVISAYPGRMKEILEIIKSLDKPSKAVLLEVRILQLTLKPSYDQGISWEKTFQQTEKSILDTTDFQGLFPIDTAAGAGPVTHFGKLLVGNLTADDFTIEIKALKQVQNTKVLANPRIMVLNNQEAKINIGDRVPYVITTTTGTGNNVSVSEEIKFIDIGLLLNVTPTINDDGYITLNIRPEISSQTGSLTTPTNNIIPIVNTTSLESQLIIKNGVTVIMGGLRRDDLTQDTRGFPVLMDMPVVGNLFKSRNETLTKTEIVILITPKIVRGDKNVTDQPLAIKGDLPYRNAAGFNGGYQPEAEMQVTTDPQDMGMDKTSSGFGSQNMVNEKKSQTAPLALTTGI